MGVASVTLALSHSLWLHLCYGGLHMAKFLQATCAMRIKRKNLKLVTLIKYRTVYATDVASLCYSWFSRLIDGKKKQLLYLSTSIQGCYEGPCSHANTFQDQPKQQRCRVRFLALNTFALLRLR